MREINLTKGKKALVDSEWQEMLDCIKWHTTSKGYAATNVFCAKSNKFTYERMHRVIIDAKKGEIVDHINRNKLDNRLENLRIVSNTQNCANSSARKNSRSKYKGVYLRNDGKKTIYRAMIKIDGINYNLLQSEDEKKCAAAYNNIAREWFGKFAYINKLD